MINDTVLYGLSCGAFIVLGWANWHWKSKVSMSAMTLGLGIILVIVAMRLHQGWRDDLVTTLWMMLAASGCSLAGWSLRQYWLKDLVPFFLLYAGIFAGIAALVSVAPLSPTKTIELDLSPVIIAHIIVSIIGYGLMALTALLAVAIILRERGLNSTMGPDLLSSRLPPLAQLEKMEWEVGAIALGALIVASLSGIVVGYWHGIGLLTFDHKTVFSMAAVVVLMAMIGLGRFAGWRGQRLARLLLVAWLLLLLAWPGVKFVRSVLLA